jgi:hypothetical protein
MTDKPHWSELPGTAPAVATNQTVRELRTELTPIGEQFVIPGCEHKKPPALSAKVRHPTLWD